MTRRAALAALIVYAVAALADAGLHLGEPPVYGTPRFGLGRIIVAGDAGLFWPVDIIAALLLAAR